MSSLRVLLIQCRSAKSRMLRHEVACIRRRLANQDVQLSTRQAVSEPATAAWLDGNDVVIMGGSGAFSVQDPRSQGWVDPLRHTLDRILSRNIPFFGICFGHQLLGLHLGGEVRTSEDHSEVGSIQVGLTRAGRADPVFGALPVRFTAQTGHSDSVFGPPAELRVLAQNHTLDTQAFHLTGRPVYTTQFHPDLTGMEARERYRSFEADIRRAGGAPKEGGSEKFSPAPDTSSQLLGRFIAHVLKGDT